MMVWRLSDDFVKRVYTACIGMLLKDPGQKKPVFSYHTNLICERQGLYVTHFCVFVCGHCLRGAKLVSAAFALGFTP